MPGTRGMRGNMWTGVRTTASVAAIFCAMLCRAAGEDEKPGPAVEVASVKRHVGELPASGGTLVTSGRRIAIHGFSPVGLIWFAFDIRMDQVKSATPLEHTYYDVDVLADGERTLTREEFRPLVRSVLAERFGLKTHWEERPTPVYALVQGKHALQLRESAPDTTAGVELLRDGHNLGSMRRRTTMAEVAQSISSSAGLDRPVVDATGLTAYYDVRLVYTSTSRLIPGDPNVIDVFTAVREQLGLELVGRTMPLRMLVVDHIERPSEN